MSKNNKKNVSLYKKIFNNELWLREIKWKNIWKTLTIVWATHWDEKIWMLVFDYLLNIFWFESKITKWKINFLIWNKESYLRWKKFIDTDFNRIWNFDNKEQGTYEYTRWKEIRNILLKSDYIIDIHSTTNPSEPMIITGKHYDYNVLKKLNIKYVITNLSSFLHWKPLIWVSSKNNSFVIEWWQSWNQHTVQKTVDNILVILQHYWYINSNFSNTFTPNYIINKLTVQKCFYAKSMNIIFKYSDTPCSFDTIKKWEVIYEDNNEKVFAEENFIILMPTKPRYIWEEIWYVLT